MSAEARPLRCQELVELLTDYLEGDLDAARRVPFERHVVTCRCCSNYVAQMRRTVDLLGRAGSADPASTPSDRLLAIFRDWQATRPPT